MPPVVITEFGSLCRANAAIAALLLLTLAGCAEKSSCEYACEELSKCKLPETKVARDLEELVCAHGIEACDGEFYPAVSTPDTTVGQAGCVVDRLNSIASLMAARFVADGGLWDPIDSESFCLAVGSILSGKVGQTGDVGYFYACGGDDPSGGTVLDVCIQVHEELGKTCKLTLPPKS